jgi:hypothetical protein
MVLGGGFDGFGGDLQIGQHFHGFTPCDEGQLIATTASMRRTPGEDSRSATPSSASAWYSLRALGAQVNMGVLGPSTVSGVLEQLV